MTGQRKTGAVLVIDDDPDVAEMLTEILEDIDEIDCDVTCAYTAEEGRAAVKAGHEGVIFLDIGLGADDGLEVLKELLALNPANRIIIITGSDNEDMVVQANRAGAFNFVGKASPDMNERVGVETRNAFAAMESERNVQQTDLLRRSGTPVVTLISKSTAMKPVLEGIQKLATSRVSVLIQGASGTGKEVVARAIHAGGPRAKEPFIAVNCAGIPDNLLESELLGHERGAFTGAVARKMGMFERAHGGTIFLDEIGEMSLPLQAKILRVVQDGKFERLGGTRQVEVDVRVLSATNRNLSQRVAQREFREDLYYRLAVFTLKLPILAARPEDVRPLAEHFFNEACREEQRTLPLKISDEVYILLKRHPWPGNVRQLQNVIKHAVVMCTTDELIMSNLPTSFSEGLPKGNGSMVIEAAVAALSMVPDDADLEQMPLPGLPRVASGSVDVRLDRALGAAFPNEDTLPDMEQLQAAGLRLAQRRLGNNRSLIAQRLGISRATLYRRLGQLPDTEAPN